MSINLKEIWRRLKHWQRGGIIGALFGIVLTYLIFNGIIFENPKKLGFFLKALDIISFYGYALLHALIFGIRESKIVLFLSYLLALVYYFILGAMVDQIYYEFKNPEPIFDKSRIIPRVIALIILSFHMLLTFVAYVLSVLD